jgi:hypothetical protein
MKSNKILVLSTVALAVASTLGAVSVNAFEVRVSGASALRNTVPRLMDRFCKPNATATPRTAYYAESLTTPNTRTENRVVFSCTLHDQTSLTALYGGINAGDGKVIYDDLNSKSLVGKELDFYHSVEPGVAALDPLVGGSITGIIPLMTGSDNGLVKFVKKEAVNLTTFPAKTLGAYTGTFAGATQYISSGDQTGSVDPHMSLTDVEPGLFTTAYGNLPTNATAIAAGWKLPVSGGRPIDPTVLTSTPAFIGSMGVAASANLIAAGITNLSSDQLAAVMTGTISNWKSLNGPDMLIRVCRRAPGSGTQATFNQLVSRKGCKANASGAEFTVGAVSQAYAASYTTQPRIVEAATSSDMLKCLEQANDTGSTVTSYGAVGLLGLESNSPTAKWNYLSFNGVQIFDATESAATPKYDGTTDKILEQKIIDGQWPLQIVSTAVKSQKLTLSADQTNFFGFLGEKAGDTVFTKALPGVVSLPGKRANAAAKVNNHGGFAGNFSRSPSTCNPLRYVP